MRKICSISAQEKQLLEDIDRIIDWHIANDKKLDKVLLSSKQAKQFSKLAEKASGNVQLICSEGGVDLKVSCKGSLDASRYRGVAIYAKPHSKRNTKKQLTPLAL